MYCSSLVTNNNTAIQNIIIAWTWHGTGPMALDFVNVVTISIAAFHTTDVREKGKCS